MPVIGLEPTAHFQNYVVARVGVEPTRDCSPKLLRLSCLPVPAPSPIRCEISVCQCFHVQNDHKNIVLVCFYVFTLIYRQSISGYFFSKTTKSFMTI